MPWLNGVTAMDRENPNQERTLVTSVAAYYDRSKLAELIFKLSSSAGPIKGPSRFTIFGLIFIIGGAIYILHGFFAPIDNGIPPEAVISAMQDQTEIQAELMNKNPGLSESGAESVVKMMSTMPPPATEE